MTIITIEVSNDAKHAGNVSASDRYLKVTCNVDRDQFMDGNKVKIPSSHRFRWYGFGSFVLFLKPQEVSITPEAMEMLQRCIGRKYSSLGDLFGLSYEDSPQSASPDFLDPHINWASREQSIIVPIEDTTISRSVYNSLVTQNNEH